MVVEIWDPLSIYVFAIIHFIIIWFIIHCNKNLFINLTLRYLDYFSEIFLSTGYGHSTQTVKYGTSSLVYMNKSLIRL